MPTYPLKHKETGETQELIMSMKEYDRWRKDNPDWDKDWSKGVAGVGEVGEWQKDWQAGVASMSTEFKWTGEAKSSGWNEVLDRASKQPGATVRKHRDYSF